MRKPGKLPHQAIGHDYALEYGTNRVEVHVDGVAAGERVVVVDDLLATGGTAGAALALLAQVGATVVECAFVIDDQHLGRLCTFAVHVSQYGRDPLSTGELGRAPGRVLMRS